MRDFHTEVLLRAPTSHVHFIYSTRLGSIVSELPPYRLDHQVSLCSAADRSLWQMSCMSLTADFQKLGSFRKREKREDYSVT